MSEMELILSCQKNDSASQRIIYDQYSDAFRGYIYQRLPDRSAIDPILNEAFARAFKNIHKYHFQGSFQGWLRTIVRHAVSDYREKKVNQNLTYIDDIGVGNIANSQVTVNEGETQVNMEDHLAIIRKTLTPRELKIFTLFCEGYQHSEIGEKLGITESTAKWQMSKARTKLRNKITKASLVSSR